MLSDCLCHLLMGSCCFLFCSMMKLSVVRRGMLPLSFSNINPCLTIGLSNPYHLDTITLIYLAASRVNFHMSLVVRKPAFCICENKDADQLRGNREADQRLCIRYTDSTTPLLPKSEI